MPYDRNRKKKSEWPIGVSIGVVGALCMIAMDVSNIALFFGAEPLIRERTVELLLEGLFIGSRLGVAIGFIGLGVLHNQKLPLWVGLLRIVFLADLYFVGLTAGVLGIGTGVLVIGLEVATMVVLFRISKVRFVYLVAAILLVVTFLLGLVPNLVFRWSVYIVHNLAYLGIFGLNVVWALKATKQVGTGVHAPAPGGPVSAAGQTAPPQAGNVIPSSPTPEGLFVGSGVSRARMLVAVDCAFPDLDRSVQSLSIPVEARGPDAVPGEPTFATWRDASHRIAYHFDPSTGARRLEITGANPSHLKNDLINGAYLPTLEGYKVSSLLQSQLIQELLLGISAAEFIGVDGNEQYYFSPLSVLARHPDPAVAAAATRAYQALASAAPAT